MRNNQPGGGVCILVNPDKFFIAQPKVLVPEGVEVVWCVISPKNTPKQAKIKNICISSVYISPKSRYKKQTIAHIVESIHLIRSYYDNSISFCISGDFNKYPYQEILDCLGSLQNIQNEATRKGEVLDLIITDMHTSYLPSLTLPPLEVDDNKKGVPSDHRILIFPPAKNEKCVIQRQKVTFQIRPLPLESVNECGKYLGTYSWENIYNCENANEKAAVFHEFLMSTLCHFFPEKEVKKSPFDKKWFTPSIKYIHRKKQREFFKHRKSQKFISLQKKFRQMKRANIHNYYTNLAVKIKSTNPRNYFQIIKMLSGTQDASGSDWDIDELRNLTASAAADKIADHFSAISCSYQPVQLDSLPAYLPAPLPPQVTELQVYQRLSKLKSTRSTFPIDLPQKLRKEYDIFLSRPLTDIYNSCLTQNIFPDTWKLEYVTPIGKVPHVKKNVRHPQDRFN